VKIQIILGSIRQNRFGERPAQWLLQEARKREGVEFELIDLKDHPLPMFAEPTPPGRLKGNYPNEVVARWARKVAEADGYILVTPEYNHGYPPSLKNALDHIYEEWTRKPVAFVGYGGAGGARAVEQLRLVTIELEMAPTRHAVHILPEVFRAALSGQAEPFEPLKSQAERMLDQLLWWARALKKAREQRIE
jgi:NAD(P)H-dependent FMN reductase